MTAHNYHPTCHFSPYALDPDTPESDYEVHLIRTLDPAYIPPSAKLGRSTTRSSSTRFEHFPMQKDPSGEPSLCS